jgi:hypothetical protein
MARPDRAAGLYGAINAISDRLDPLIRRFALNRLSQLISRTDSITAVQLSRKSGAVHSTNGFTWGYPFRRGRHSLMLWPSRLLTPLTVRHCNAAPEGFYVRAFRRFVTSSTVEYATRLTGRLPGLVLHQQEGQPLSAAHSQDKRIDEDGLSSPRP